jgi:signal transduction histidine kinase
MNSSHITKRKLIGLSQRYRSLLRKHLQEGPQASLQTARALGRQAVAQGLETLDLARIHDEALTTLDSSIHKDGTMKRAEAFFTEALNPVEKTHRAALKANVHLSQLSKTLGRRMTDLAASNRSLKQGIVRRKAAEKALKKSGEQSQKLLRESRRLQKHLQNFTHRIRAAQEGKRKKISHDLQNEIAQTLLGIRFRLLSLKQQAAVDTEGLEKEIGNTRQLVDKSMKSIKRFAREFGKHHET